MKYTLLLLILITNVFLLKAGDSISFWPPVDPVSDNLISQLEIEHNTNRSPYDYSRMILQNAIIQYQRSEYLQSFITFYKNAPFFTEIGDIRNAARCYANMGLIFMELEEYKNAITHLQKADTLFDRLNAIEEHLFCKKDLALCWGSLGNKKKACEILKAILHKDLSQIHNIKLKIACLFAYCDYLDNIEDEKVYILDAYNLALRTNDPNLIRIAVLNMSWLNFKTGNLMQAEKLANQVYSSFNKNKDEANLVTLKGNTYNLLSQIYAKKNRWDKAYYFQILYEECQRMNNKITAIKHIQHLEIRKEIEKHQLMLKQTQMEMKQRQERSVIIRISLAALLAMSGVIIFLLYKREQTEKKLRKIEKKEYTEKLVNEQHKVNAKSRELSSNGMLLMKKNEVLKKLKNQIDEYKEAGQIEAPTEKEIKDKINEALTETNDWEAFKLQFNEIHPLFFKTLLKDHPTLSNNDLRLCAYLKMHLSTKQIARLISVQPQTVTIARYRMKKKMNLDKDASLDEYIEQIDS